MLVTSFPFCVAPLGNYRTLSVRINWFCRGILLLDGVSSVSIFFFIFLLGYKSSSDGRKKGDWVAMLWVLHKLIGLITCVLPLCLFGEITMVIHPWGCAVGGGGGGSSSCGCIIISSLTTKSGFRNSLWMGRCPSIKWLKGNKLCFILLLLLIPLLSGGVEEEEVIVKRWCWWTHQLTQ